MISFVRVMINPYEATTPKRAIQLGSSDLVIGFKRNDGWTLGAPYGLEGVAYRMWPKEWTHFTTDLETWRPIEEYKR